MEFEYSPRHDRRTSAGSIGEAAAAFLDEENPWRVDMEAFGTAHPGSPTNSAAAQESDERDLYDVATAPTEVPSSGPLGQLMHRRLKFNYRGGLSALSTTVRTVGSALG